MNYFNNCKSIDDVKKIYRKLAAQLHPDMNLGRDTTAEFQAMANEYEKAFNKFKNTFTNAEGKTYEKENKESFSEYADIINKIIHFEGVKIEIIGTWIWVSGATKEYKEELKKLKFKWNQSKLAWFHHNDDFRKKSRTALSFDEMRDFYGSSEIESEQLTKIS